MTAERKESLETIRSIIHNKIFGSNRDLSFMDRLKQPGRLTQLLSILGTVFKKTEQENVRQFLADFFAGEIVQIADNDNEEIEGASSKDTLARAKLRIETRRWLMEQFAPQLYGSNKTAWDGHAPLLQTKVYLPENGRS